MDNTITLNPEKYSDIVDRLSEGGKENVHILADFDKTLTKAFIKGESFPSLISILRNNKSILGEEYAEKAHALYNHYSVVEKNPKLSTEEKKFYMEEWWRKHQELLVESGLTREHIKQAVDSGYLEFREGIVHFIELLNTKNIPLVIISANGIGTDSIRMFFEKHNLMSDNIFIISNELKFDENGVTSGFDKRVIHSFNKSEAIISDYPEIHEKIVDRKNVILMGDSLGDTQMVEGFDYSNLLKIGFFNNRPDVSPLKEPEILKQFEELYDILYVGDSGLKHVNNMLEKIK